MAVENEKEGVGYILILRGIQFMVTVSRIRSDFIIWALNELRSISDNSRFPDAMTRYFVVVLYIDPADTTIPHRRLQWTSPKIKKYL